MQKIYQKTAAIAFSAVVGIGTITAPTQAATLTWGLSFFDTAGNPVGTGEFSYDDEALTFVQTLPISAPVGFEVRNALTNFSATVLGKSWSLGDRPGVTWWQPTDSKNLGQQVISRYGIFIADTWFFGDVGSGIRQFSLQGNQQNSAGWGGSWVQSVVGLTPSFGSGSWSASPSSAAVPEPSTVLGLTLVGVGVWFRKKTKKP
ncbi:PEP-CTERM sorting domain-containing protein [Leptolyngbyaceae cyanobacterium UHCC 1019]